MDYKNKPWELWQHLRSAEYHTSEYCKLDWNIEIDDENKKIRAIFQESRQPIDWILNFVFMLIPAIIGGTPYNFSLGWWISWCSAKELVMHNIMSEWEKHNDYDIQVCGYSFGGAIAQICGIEIFERMGIKSELITFGAPKPLFGLWTKFLTRRCFTEITQYANWSDIVTWCIPLIGYHGTKIKRLGKFSLKKLLFDAPNQHQIYSNVDFYKE